MKKRLEADLVSIAHRILQLKNKSDVNVLFLETQKLYEKLAILKFVEENLGESKPTIGQASLEAEIEKAFDLSEIKTVMEPIEVRVDAVDENEAVVTEAIALEEDILEKIAPEASLFESLNPVPDVILGEVATPEAFVPLFEAIAVTPEKIEIENPNEIVPKKEVVQISFEDLLGGSFADAQFVKKEHAEIAKATIAFDKVATLTEEKEIKSKSLNDKLSKGISIDLNDRIGFVKHLFGNSNEDYNRVLSQLNSFNNFYETKSFIDEMIKPEYNNWEGKDDYANRFMEMVEKKFL
ncbi:hypothetical protein [Flavobacterium sp. TSSA_36]|uniref:hypothetical protein n=1 Tax=Flavobacterium sp. TSSA_36 TaxID=3447669 RepID=UPI003F3EE2F5